MLSRSGKKEGIDFKHNKWIYFIVLAAVLGAISGLYDKYLMAPPENGGVGLDRMIVQSWYNIYQCFLMGAMLLMIWWPTKKNSTQGALTDGASRWSSRPASSMALAVA